jgi:pimeloyl-ACP methyl ester carboxylesterase
LFKLPAATLHEFMNQPRQPIGKERDWIWRGWQIRYTYSRPAHSNKQPPLILLHGFGGSIGHWRNNLEVWAEQYPVYAMDLVGFGASRKPPTQYDIELWVEQLHDFWQTFVGEPMVIVGNSIGSLVGLVAAATYPEMAKSLIMISLFDPSAEQEIIPRFLHPTANFLKLALVPRWLLRGVFRIVKKPKVARLWAKFAYANDLSIDDELMEIFLRPAQEAEAPTAFTNILRGMVSLHFSPNIRRFLPRMKVPMLLLWGHNDKIIPRNNVEKLVRITPNLRFIELADAGHCAHDEVPDQVNTIVSSWLAELQPKAISGTSVMPVQLFDDQQPETEKNTHPSGASIEAIKKTVD